VPTRRSPTHDCPRNRIRNRLQIQEDTMSDHDDALPADWFARVDETPDTAFYGQPRLVTHIDDATIAALTDYYREVLPPGGALLDLMSSWVSHLPPEVAFARVAGLGMNGDELAANPRLDDAVVGDLNQAPVLPYADAAFDAVMIVVSVQYLVRPVEVFREVARVLRPNGRLIVAMSHRCVPTKAVLAFRQLSARDRIHLVGMYCQRAGGFRDIAFVDRSPEGADPLWIVTAVRDGTG
jgi:SAM-dependent methyltransferase